MDIGINYAAKRLKQQLIADVNAASLPTVIVRAVFGELYEQAKQLEQQCISEEKATYEKALIEEREKAKAAAKEAKVKCKQKEAEIPQETE